MKRIVPLLIIGIIVLSGLGAAAVSNISEETLQKTETISFSTPQIQTKEGYALVTVDDANAWLYNTGAPMLPASITTYLFPFGTKIRSVDVTFSNPEVYILENKIIPTPTPVSFVAGNKVTFTQEEQVIGSIYPDTLFDYHIGAGISNEEHVIFLTVRCYPIQYNIGENTILYRNIAHLSITYELPSTETSSLDEFKLLIIAPKAFSENLQQLVNHKISKGITTKLVTRDDICNSVYFPAEGRDCAEEMKYFIKNAFDQ
ncbi:MAG TPA: C25 family cysteine peptidase, partial [Candidatus Thermoplasmatota archaeon]|nr:C25 family cysteine peptidase [Candidatus Thermoplasmatota archaeon]